MKKALLGQHLAILLAGLLLAFNTASFAQQASELDRGRALLKEGKCPEAIEAFQRHLETDKNSWQSYYNIGWCYAKLNKPQEAILSFRKVLEIKSDAADAYDYLAVLYGQTDNDKEAIPLLEKLITIKPNEARYYFNLGVSYFNIQQFEKAVEAYKKAVQLAPAKENYQTSLAAAETQVKYFAIANEGLGFFKEKDFKKAASKFEEASKLNRNPGIFFYLGNAYYLSEQYSKAASAYQQSLNLDPNYPKAKEYLADAEQAKKEGNEKKKAKWMAALGTVADALTIDDKTTTQDNQTQSGGATDTGGSGGPLSGRFSNPDQGIRSFTFSTDGTFVRGGAVSGSVRGGTYVAGSSNSGTYSLNGEVINLKYQDGREEQLPIRLVVGESGNVYQVVIGGVIYTKVG